MAPDLLAGLSAMSCSYTDEGGRMIIRRIRRFRDDEHGLALVELALGLPLMLFFFAAVVEGGRLFYSYQAVIDGVRAASRYAARAVPSDLCSTGNSIGSYIAKSTLEGFLERNANVNSAFPPLITVTGVTISRRCVGAAGEYRVSPAPVLEVVATLEIQFPFSGFARFATGQPLATVTTTVSDESRIFGS